MSKDKSGSVSSDRDLNECSERERYESLRNMDNRAYINMPEQEDYLNPVSSDKMDDDIPPPPPEKDPPSKRSSSGASNKWAPLPPKRDQSSSSDKFTASNSSIGSNVSIRYPKMGNGELTLEKKMEKEKVLLRQKNSAFDSGVGDLEHVHIEGMNQNKNYDYADYGHQYEELPSRKSIAKYPMDNGDSRSEFYQSSGGATDIVSDVEDTQNIVNSRGEKRKRVNPLYDAMTQSMPSIYNKSKPAVDEKILKQVRCLKCVVIFLLVLTLLAVGISVFAVISYNQSKDDPDPLLTSKVQQLSQDFTQLEELLSSFDDSNDTMKILSDLIKKVNVLEGNVSSQTHSLYEQIVTNQNKIDRNSQAIVDSHSNISSVISFLNMTLQLQLHNISKQQGPRGPQGVANFSRCTYYNVTSEAVASDAFPNFSPWAPTEIDLEKNIALFSSCSVEGGTKEFLEVNAMTSQRVQFRCRCTGIIQGQNRRECTIHLLMCPRQS